MMKGFTPQGVIGPTSTSTSIITLTALRRGALQPTSRMSVSNLAYQNFIRFDKIKRVKDYYVFSIYLFT